MVKPWDNGMKRLLAESPQDFLDWLLDGAYFTGKRSHEFESRTFEADAMHEVIFHDQRMLFHLEFQSGPDPDMELRLLEYCVMAYRRYRCPVYSIVVYLREGGDIASTPFIITSPDGEQLLRFHFHTILLWNIPYRELMDRRLPGILPRVPLARGGADREVIEEVIALLMPMEEPVKRELLALTLLFASLAFERSEDQEWIRRKFEMLKDILRGTPAYQYIYEEGREEEHQKHLRSLQYKIFEIVQKRYPRLAKLAQKQVAGIVQTELLEDLLIKVAMAPTQEEAQNALLSSDDEQDS